MNRRFAILLASLSLAAAACGGGDATASTEARALERARELAAATTIEGGKSMFEYFPEGQVIAREFAPFGRSH